MEVQEALPVFLDGLESTVGELSDQQRSCVREGYVSLPGEVLAAARQEAVGATVDRGSADELGEMVRRCGVELGE
jgi:hypothetical protein